MAQARDENFPVASLVIGRAARRHLLAIYGFARLVDDTGDEVGGSTGDRAALLERIDDELTRLYSGRAPEHPVMQTLARSVWDCGLPEEPLRRLLEANRRDQVQSRYETFDDLMSYCRLSAAPVGELVLRLFGAATPARIALSNRVCAALQVLEHLQDVGEDAARGRVYLPREDMDRCGCEESALHAATAGEPLRAVIRLMTARSRELLGAGGPLLRGLRPRARLVVAGFIAGGRATVTALERADHDVLGTHPRRSPGVFAAALAGTVLGR